MREGWRETTLGAITTKIVKSAPTQDFDYVDISSVSRDAKAITAPARTKAGDAPGRARQHLRTDDVLVSTVRPNLNAVARVPEELDGAVGSTGFAVLRASDEVHPGILFAVARSSKFVETMTEWSTGSNYPAVTDKIVREFPLVLPPLDEQRRIADLIAAVDDAVDAAAAEAGSADEVVSAFLTSRFATALRGPLTFGDHVEAGGGSVNVDPLLRYSIVGVLNRGRGVLERGPITGSETSYARLNVIGPETLVYSRLKAFEGAMTVTPRELGVAYASPEFPSFAPLPNTSPDWLREITRCPELWELLASRSKGMGGRRERLKPADFLAIPLTSPPLEVQMELASTAGALRDAADAARATVESLRTLRSNLLTVLLSGEHEIPASYDALLGEVA